MRSQRIEGCLRAGRRKKVKVERGLGDRRSRMGRVGASRSEIGLGVTVQDSGRKEGEVVKRSGESRS